MHPVPDQYIIPSRVSGLHFWRGVSGMRDAEWSGQVVVLHLPRSWHSTSRSLFSWPSMGCAFMAAGPDDPFWSPTPSMLTSWRPDTIMAEDCGATTSATPARIL